MTYSTISGRPSKLVDSHESGRFYRIWSIYATSGQFIPKVVYSTIIPINPKSGPLILVDYKSKRSIVVDIIVREFGDLSVKAEETAKSLTVNTMGVADLTREVDNRDTTPSYEPFPTISALDDSLNLFRSSATGGLQTKKKA